MRITAFTAEPLALLRYTTLLREDGTPALTLTGGRVAKGGVVARAKEIETREQAEAAARPAALHRRATRCRQPDEDEFYLADLIGLEVREPGRRRARQGQGGARTSAPATCWRSRPPAGGPSWWLPFTREAVPEVAHRRAAASCIDPPAGDARHAGRLGLRLAQPHQAFLGDEATRTPSSLKIWPRMKPRPPDALGLSWA